MATDPQFDSDAWPLGPQFDDALLEYLYACARCAVAEVQARREAVDDLLTEKVQR